jgi:hypothetical protein
MPMGGGPVHAFPVLVRKILSVMLASLLASAITPVAAFASVSVDELQVLGGHRSGTASLNRVAQPDGSELGDLIAGDHDVVEDVLAVTGGSAVRRAIVSDTAKIAR